MFTLADVVLIILTSINDAGRICHFQYILAEDVLLPLMMLISERVYLRMYGYGNPRLVI